MIARISALFEALTIPDVQAEPPAHRRRFAQYARYWAEIADPMKPPPSKGGKDLKAGSHSD